MVELVSVSVEYGDRAGRSRQECAPGPLRQRFSGRRPWPRASARCSGVRAPVRAGPRSRTALAFWWTHQLQRIVDQDQGDASVEGRNRSPALFWLGPAVSATGMTARTVRSLGEPGPLPCGGPKIFRRPRFFGRSPMKMSLGEPDLVQEQGPTASEAALSRTCWSWAAEAGSPRGRRISTGTISGIFENSGGPNLEQSARPSDASPFSPQAARSGRRPPGDLAP